MNGSQKKAGALRENHTWNRRAEAVRDPLFQDHPEFFDARDLVQVKYEMLRRHFVDGVPVAGAAVSHGYSRGGFYVVAGSFAERGMAGLLDERRGRKGPVKLTEEVVAFVRGSPRSSSVPALVEAISEQFGISVHRRTVERLRQR